MSVPCSPYLQDSNGILIRLLSPCDARHSTEAHWSLSSTTIHGTAEIRTLMDSWDSRNWASCLACLVSPLVHAIAHENGDHLHRYSLLYWRALSLLTLARTIRGRPELVYHDSRHTWGPWKPTGDSRGHDTLCTCTCLHTRVNGVRVWVINEEAIV